MWLRHLLPNEKKAKEATEENEKRRKFPYAKLFLDISALFSGGFFIFYLHNKAELRVDQTWPYILGCAGSGFLVLLVVLLPSSRGRRITAVAISFVLTVLLLGLINVQGLATPLALQILGIRSAPSDILIFSNAAKETLLGLQDPKHPLEFCKIGKGSQSEDAKTMWVFADAELLLGIGTTSTVRVNATHSDKIDHLDAFEREQAEARRSEAVVQIRLPAEEVKVMRNSAYPLLERVPSRCPTH